MRGLPWASTLRLQAEDGQIRRPAAIERAAAVVLVGVYDAVAIAIVAEQELGGHALHQQQLFESFEGAVLAPVGGSQRKIIIAFGAVGAGIVVGVDPIEDRVGDVIGHIGQFHQHVVADLPAVH